MHVVLFSFKCLCKSLGIVVLKVSEWKDNLNIDLSFENWV